MNYVMYMYNSRLTHPYVSVDRQTGDYQRCIQEAWKSYWRHFCWQWRALTMPSHRYKHLNRLASMAPDGKRMLYFWISISNDVRRKPCFCWTGKSGNYDHYWTLVAAASSLYEACVILSSCWRICPNCITPQSMSQRVANLRSEERKSQSEHPIKRISLKTFSALFQLTLQIRYVEKT